MLPGLAAATSLTIEVPMADTMVRQSHPDSNFSGSAELRVSRNWCGDTSITLIQPNLDALKSVAVESAILTIVKLDSPWSLFGWAPSQSISLRPIESAWNPEQVTWSSRPEAGEAALALTVSTADPTGTVYEFDLTELMNSWLTEEVPILGFELVSDSRKSYSAGRYGSIDGPGWSAPALTVMPVPEPGTALLVGVGMGLMCLHGRD